MANCSDEGRPTNLRPPEAALARACHGSTCQRQERSTRLKQCRGSARSSAERLPIGSPTPVSHIANAVAIPTAAFMIVIVSRYAEMSLSICCEISTTWRLLLERGSISTRRCRKISPDTRMKKRNSTVVKKPLAKFRVPVNRFSKTVAPRSEMAPFGDGPVSPIFSTCCKNTCSVLMGARMKLNRSSSRGMPSGSFAAQVRAGPDMAVPKPMTIPKSARISSSAASIRGTCNRSNTRKAGCSRSLRTMAKTNGNKISLTT